MRCSKCGKLRWGSAKYCKKCGQEFSAKPKIKKRWPRAVKVIVIIIIFLLAGFVYLGIILDKKFNDAVTGIQANLADVAIAKTSGDSLMAGKKMEVTADNLFKK